MARLVIRSAGFGSGAIELNLGVNRLGRSPKNDIRLDHSTVSALHCEVALTEDGVMVRDCHSTNGTFVN
ncbi:MAG: FHA domain-containing protein, partial [Verrucomicrobia bacterium]|nr:FHA domain-containing protein [Verrucomicrobiota bacterium]